MICCIASDNAIFPDRAPAKNVFWPFKQARCDTYGSARHVYVRCIDSGGTLLIFGRKNRQPWVSVLSRCCSLIPGLGVKLSTIILAGPTVLSAVGGMPSV